MKTANVDAHSNFTARTYDVPFFTPYLQKLKIVKYLPNMERPTLKINAKGTLSKVCRLAPPRNYMEISSLSVT